MPLFSIVTPVYNPPASALVDCIQSMQDQLFQDWEWCVVDDRSTHPYVQNILARAAAKDSRIRIALRETNGGIVAASQDGLDMSIGRFVGLLDHDDALHPQALSKVAAALIADETIDYVYTDEDKIDATGKHYDNFKKPPFDQSRLRGQNYCCHFSVFRSTLLDEIGGFRQGFDGSQDYDLILRATERARKILHIPEVLYHWRVVPGSAAGDPTAKPYAYDAGQRALEQHFVRSGVSADVSKLQPGSYSHHFTKLPTSPLVSIVIPTQGQSERIWGLSTCLIDNLLQNIFDITAYPNFEIIVVDNVHAHPSEQIAHDFRSRSNVSVITPAKSLNFYESCNAGFNSSSGEVVILLSDRTQIITPTWIEQFLGHLQDPQVSIAGPMIRMDDGRIESCGITLSPQPLHIGWGESSTSPGMWGNSSVARSVSAVTDTCLAIKRDAFVQLGGFSPALIEHGGGLDLCFKARENGFRVVWTPTVQIYHFGSHPQIVCPNTRDASLIERRWKRYFETERYSVVG